MLEEYIKETVKNELAKQKLNGMYGKNKQVLKQENEKLKHKIKQDSEAYSLELETIMIALEITRTENEKLKKENEQLKNLSCTIVVGNDGKLDSLFNQKLKSENEKLKKELLDSKNGLNGANYVIKNNKEWINLQDKKIKQLEEEIRAFKSDKEDLQYNLRRKSTQKNQLETKNKCLEEKFKRIYKTIEENYYQDGYYELLRIKNIVVDILKES